MINKCDICGGEITKEFSLKFRSIIGMADEYTHDIGMCQTCQSIFTINPFSPEKLANRYKNNSKYEFDEDSYFLSDDKDYKIRCERQKSFINRVIGINNINSILEIGSASGYNLSLYNSDCKTYGIEPSEINCKNAKKYYNVDMFRGMFTEYLGTQPKEKYDLIFLSHTLEHIVNPCTFIKQCSNLNSKYFFIEVPDINYKSMDEPYGIICEEHVNIFTLENLENLMYECGYKLINADLTLYYELYLPAGIPAISTIWEKVDNKENIKKHKFITSSKELLHNYLTMSENELVKINDLINTIDNNEKLAIWGTGHHVSMLIVNTDLSKKNLVRVYDSDKKKHGIKFEGIEIQAFNEDDIINKDIDTILVATYTAQIPIVKFLEKYKHKVKIVTLYDI